MVIMLRSTVVGNEATSQGSDDYDHHFKSLGTKQKTIVVIIIIIIIIIIISIPLKLLSSDYYNTCGDTV